MSLIVMYMVQAVLLWQEMTLLLLTHNSTSVYNCCSVHYCWVMFWQADVDQVKELDLENRRIAISGVACMLGILFGAIQSFLKGNLNMPCIAAKFVLPLLREEQKKNYISLY